MKNYNQEILKATEQSNKIKLHTDFNKSMDIIGKYPVLVQYIKLSDILFDWFDSMISKTKDGEIKRMKEKFTDETVMNLLIYSKNGDSNGLKPLVKDLKDSLSNMFGK